MKQLPYMEIKGQRLSLEEAEWLTKEKKGVKDNFSFYFLYSYLFFFLQFFLSIFFLATGLYNIFPII